jgi:hypothetical protein
MKHPGSCLKPGGQYPCVPHPTLRSTARTFSRLIPKSASFALPFISSTF